MTKNPPPLTIYGRVDKVLKPKTLVLRALRLIQELNKAYIRENKYIREFIVEILGHRISRRGVRDSLLELRDLDLITSDNSLKPEGKNKFAYDEYLLFKTFASQPQTSFRGIVLNDQVALTRALVLEARDIGIEGMEDILAWLKISNCPITEKSLKRILKNLEGKNTELEAYNNRQFIQRVLSNSIPITEQEWSEIKGHYQRKKAKKRLAAYQSDPARFMRELNSRSTTTNGFIFT